MVAVTGGWGGAFHALRPQHRSTWHLVTGDTLASEGVYRLRIESFLTKEGWRKTCGGFDVHCSQLFNTFTHL